MSIQEIREALSGFREKFGLSTFAELNVADLADLLVRLNEMERVILHRIEVSLDERGEDFREALKVLHDFAKGYYSDHPVPDKIEDALKVIQREDGHTTPVFVEPGVTVTVKEVGLGESIRPEGEAAPAYVKIEDDDDFTEEFLYEFRKSLPKDWDVRIVDGRLEVREWADRPEPLFHFDVTPYGSFELVVGIPEIIGAMMTQMHRDFCGLLEFTKEAVAGCADPGELAGPVVVKAKSTPVAWELSEGIEDAFPGVIVRKEKESKPCPTCDGSGTVPGAFLAHVRHECETCGGRGRLPAQADRDAMVPPCPTCKGTGADDGHVDDGAPDPAACPDCNGTGKREAGPPAQKE